MGSQSAPLAGSLLGYLTMLSLPLASVIQKSLLTKLAFDARNQGVCEKLDIMAHEGTEVSQEGSKNGMGSSSPRRQPYSPSHQPQGEWAETLIPALFAVCF